MSVGDIWHTSWGYDQTNVEFFQSIRESESSIWLARIAGRVGEDRRRPRARVRACGAYRPLPGFWTVDGLLGQTANERGADGSRYPLSVKRCRKSRYGSMKIDQARRAYPYDLQADRGCWDTRASGAEGH